MRIHPFQEKFVFRFREDWELRLACGLCHQLVTCKANIDRKGGRERVMPTYCRIEAASGEWNTHVHEARILEPMGSALITGGSVEDDGKISRLEHATPGA